MLTLNVIYHCKPGKREDFHKALTELGARAVSNSEKGNRKYDYFFDAQDPDALFLLENWETQEDLDAHFATASFAKLQELKGIYCDNVELKKFITE